MGAIQVLAALDVHTAKWIVEKCLLGDLIRGRTVLLVVSCYHLFTRTSHHFQTHNVAMASTAADFVVSIGKEGRILSQCSVSEAMVKDEIFADKVIENEQALEIADGILEPKTENEVEQAVGKLVVKEEIDEGHVSWSARALFCCQCSLGF
jgi:hypothetical protein